MKRIITYLSILSFVVVTKIHAQQQVSIFDREASLFIDKVEVTLNNSGVYSINLPDIPIDEESLMVFGDVTINEFSLRRNYNQNTVWDVFIGKKITLVGDKTELTGILKEITGKSAKLELSTGQSVYIPDLNAYVIYGDDFTIKQKPPSKLQLEVVILGKKKGKANLEIIYRSPAFTWLSRYMIVVDEQYHVKSLNGSALIRNSTNELFDGLKANLVFGNMYSNNRSRGYENKMMVQAFNDEVVEAVGDMYQYPLSGMLKFEKQEQKNVNLVSSKSLKSDFIYKYQSNGDAHDLKPEITVWIDLSSDKSIKGALPAGNVELFMEKDGVLNPVTRTRIGHTPRNGKMELSLGRALDITIKEEKIDSKRITNKISEDKYRIEIKNSKNDLISVQIERVMYESQQIIFSTEQFEKKSVNYSTATLEIGKNQTRTLEYTIRTEYQ